MSLPPLEIISVSALVINAAVLIIVLYQSFLSTKTLKATHKDLEEEQKERQLLFLPKLEFVLEVRMQLKKWERDLIQKRKQIEEAIKKQRGAILKELSEQCPNEPKDLKLSKEMYQEMPGWLREMWISGAKYYYEAANSLNNMHESTANFHHAKGWINGRGKNSIEALQVLLKHTKDMVPSVILHTPSAINDESFLED